MAKRSKRQRKHKGSRILWIKHHRLISFLAVLLIIFIGVSTYNKVLAWQEKKEYEKARVALEALYTDIEKNVGNPDKVERESRCGYGSAKLTRGFRGCSVSISFKYSVSGPAETTQKAESIINETNRHFDITYSDFSSKLPFRPLEAERVRDPNMRGLLISNEAVASIQSDEVINFLGYDRSCTVSFLYGRGDYYALPMPNDGSPEHLSVYLVCGGGAQAEHYPVEE